MYDVISFNLAWDCKIVFWEWVPNALSKYLFKSHVQVRVRVSMYTQ